VAAALVVVATAGLALLAPPPARASGTDDGAGAVSADEGGETPARTAARLRAEQRLRAAADADDDAAGLGASLGLGSLGGRSGLLGTALLGAAFYFFFMRGRGAGGASSSWGSYYLFWIAAPAVLAAVSSHPEFLAIIVIGLVARRWLPDPFLILKHRSRVRALQIDIDTNPSNATARRDLAKIWLEKHRPKRALPLLEQASARDPSSLELLYLSGLSHLLAGDNERAVAALVTVTHRQPTFHYGDAYLRAADALIALGRWDDADDALERYARINTSNVEGRVKRLRVCKARKDADGMRRAATDLREVWRALPAYQRRKQFGWYVRSFV